MRRDPTKM